VQITYQPDRAGFLVERPSRTVKRLLKTLGLAPRQSGATLAPDLVRVRNTFEQEVGPLPGRVEPVGAPALPYLIPRKARADQRAHVEQHIQRAHESGAISAMLCNQVCCGKTLEAISLLATLQPRRTLIVCPLGVLGTWRSELEKWLGAPLENIASNPFIFASGRKDVWSASWGGAVALRHYEALQGNCASIPATDLLIVDEAHRCSNRKKYTKTTEEAMKAGAVPVAERALTQAETIATAAKRSKHRILMTGTEARNMLQDIWGLLRLLDPKRYSSYWTFVRCYFIVEENRWGGMEIGGLLPDWQEAFAAEVSQWQTRSTRAKVFPDLGYEVQVVMVDLGASNQEEFDEKVFGPWWKHHKGPLAAITWGRQFAIDPYLVQDTPMLQWGGCQAKLLYTIDRLRDADCQVVVCSDFTRALNILYDEIGDRACKLIGGMGDKERVAARDGFEAGRYQFCLIHPQAGGEGIDLSMADRLVFLNLPWDVKTFEQVIGRVVRPGRLERGQDPCCIVEVMEATGTLDSYVRETIIEKARAYGTLNETTAGEIMAELKGRST